MYIKNCWYVACASEELKESPLGLVICDQEVVFFRNAQDQAVAVEDFCPHRGLPLSLGFLEEGRLVCGYHGLQMGENGKVHSMPRQRVQNFPCNRVYPVVERYGFVWIWAGDADKANTDSLPKFKWTQEPGWAFGGGKYHIKADYRLMIDNLMDLTHETYVHGSSIGQKEIDEEPVKTRVEDGVVITSRHMQNIQAPPFWQMAMRQKGLDDSAVVDRWQICRFQAPSHIMIDVGVALAGKGGFDADQEHKVYSQVVNFITPEHAGSHWYFWGMARTWQVDDASVTDVIKEGQGGIFAEDLDVLQKQQASLEANPDRALLKLDIDAGGIMARKMIDAILANEQ